MRFANEGGKVVYWKRYWILRFGNSAYRANFHAQSMVFANGGINPHGAVFFGNGLLGAFCFAGAAQDAGT
jgi:hypothetical protein